MQGKIMSKEKETVAGRAARGQAMRPAQPGIAQAGVASPKTDVEVVGLEIADDFDLGGDPYNHTGSHCVIEIRKD